MNRKTLEALNGSIEKWETPDDEFVDNGTNNCDLCQCFNGGGLSTNHCRNGSRHMCPVYKAVGGGGCSNTPWERWYDHHILKHNDCSQFPMKVECSYCKVLKKKEAAFLRSLLPKVNK